MADNVARTWELGCQWLLYARETDPFARMRMRGLPNDRCTVTVGGKDVTSKIMLGEGPPSMGGWPRCPHCENAPCLVATQGKNWIAEAQEHAAFPQDKSAVEEMIVEAVECDLEKKAPSCVLKWIRDITPTPDPNTSKPLKLKPFSTVQKPKVCKFCGERPCGADGWGELFLDRICDNLGKDLEPNCVRHLLRHLYKNERGHVPDCFESWVRDNIRLEEGTVDYCMSHPVVVPVTKTLLQTKLDIPLDDALAMLQEGSSDEDMAEGPRQILEPRKVVWTLW